MNPADCKPGTIVLWVATGLVGVVSHFDAEDLVRLTGCRAPSLAPAALTLAPRFLVNGEWVVEPAAGVVPSGAVAWFDAFECWAACYMDGNVLRSDVPQDSYAAAREAVEKAVGLR